MGYSYMLMPQQQIDLNTVFTQAGADSLDISDAAVIAFQFFTEIDVDDVNAAVTFSIQHATSKSDDQFFGSGFTSALSVGVQSQIIVVTASELAGYVRMQVTVGASGNKNAYPVRVQVNLKDLGG